MKEPDEAQSPEAGEASPVYRAVVDGNAVYAKAVREGRPELLMTIAGPDLQLIDPAAGAASGLDEIRDWFAARAAERPVLALERSIDAVIPMGDMAQASGTWRLRSRGPDGAKPEFGGDWVQIWQHSGGRWLLHQDVTLGTHEIEPD